MDEGYRFVGVHLSETKNMAAASSPVTPHLLTDSVPFPRIPSPPSHEPRLEALHAPESPTVPSQPENCPMNNHNLPPVGVMEHFVARCYCFLCTCGKHVCPAAARKRTEIVKSMYATNYKVEYYRKHGAPSQPLRLEDYRGNGLPMDLQTIKQRDFLPYKIQPEKSFKPKSAAQTVQFVCRSSYQANFPNWGPNEVIRVKPFWLPYRGDQVKMEPKTTYNTDFCLPLKTSDTFEQFVKSSRSSLATSGPMAAGSDFYGQTTNMRSFKPVKRGVLPTLENRRDDYMAVESPKGHFNTTYRADFFPKHPILRPMRKCQSQSLV